MPFENRSVKKQVTFALAIVKASVISNRSESSRIKAALQVMFPEVSVILVAEDDEIANYRRHQELADFARDAACRVLPSSRINLN